MKVWIDADQCMGAGTCASIAPRCSSPLGRDLGGGELAEDFGETTVFDGGAAPGHGSEGAADGQSPTGSSTGSSRRAGCPGECIYLEV